MVPAERKQTIPVDKQPNTNIALDTRGGHTRYVICTHLSWIDKQPHALIDYDLPLDVLFFDRIGRLQEVMVYIQLHGMFE